MSNVISRNLTTIDLFKCMALLCMIIDHIGMDFATHTLWWQVFGRWFGATWYLLIGYSRSRDLSAPIWIGGLALVLINMVVGLYVFPLNSLFTIIAIRLVLDRVDKFAFRNWENMLLTLFVLTLLFIPVSYLVENSTVCLLAAMLGYTIRHLRDQPDSQDGLFADPRLKPVMMWVTMAAGTAFQIFAFPFSGIQLLVMIPGFMYGLYLFCNVPFTEYPMLTARLPQWAVKSIQFCGRRTMELYVGHLALFKIIAFILAVTAVLPEPAYGLFDWDWTSTAAYQVQPPETGTK